MLRWKNDKCVGSFVTYAACLYSVAARFHQLVVLTNERQNLLAWVTDQFCKAEMEQIEHPKGVSIITG